MAANLESKIDYEAYLHEYETKKESLHQRGYEMKDPRPYSELEYRTVYRALVNDRKEDVISGKRRSIGNIRRELINGQTWSAGDTQAKALYKYAKLTGQKVKLMDIRAKGRESVDFGEYEKRYKEIISKLPGGLSKLERRKLRDTYLKELNATMFGSS